MEYKKIIKEEELVQPLNDICNEEGYQEFIKTIDNTTKQEALYGIIRERYNIEYASKEYQDLEERGIRTEDIVSLTMLSELVEKFVKKLKICSLSDYVENTSDSMLSAQYCIRKKDDEERYVLALLFTANCYSYDTWSKIKNMVDISNYGYEIIVFPRELSYLYVEDNSPYVTVLVTDMRGIEYEKVELSSDREDGLDYYDEV